MSKGSPKNITFQRTDYSLPEDIRLVCEDIANHFKSPRKYIEQFCRLIRLSSKWGIEDLEKHLELWTGKMQSIPETGNFIRLINKAFKLCKTSDDLKHLRGALVEALVIGKYGGTKILTDPHYGWGATVTIHKEGAVDTVKYVCPEVDKEGCHRRKTVDFGHWNGYHGRFYECKVIPFAIGCKEVKYMIELGKKLKDNDISYEIFFVCAEHHDNVKIRLESDELAPLLDSEIKFRPLGYNTLFAEH
ncbi:hypothetical protein ACWKS6_26235 [Bacillus cereus]